MKLPSRIQADIDLDAFAFNLESIKNNLKEDTKIITVLKADGYGHGALPLAREAVKDPRVWGVAVATVEEAEELRQGGIRKPLLILGYTYEENYEQIAREEFRPAVFKLSMARKLSQAAVKNNTVVNVHIKIDTGMSRIGYRDLETAVPEIMEISRLPGIRIEGLFTHFARADEKKTDPAYVQFRKFQEFQKALEAQGLEIPICHCSNSAGIIRMPEANLNAVRAGVILYGLYPSEDVEKEPVPLKPVMELKSHIAYIKTVEAGVQISYGGTFTTQRETRVATIPVGYADGYARGLSNKGSVLIRGKRAPILGRVCMDQFMVDVTDIPQAQELDEVVLLGRSGDEQITMEELGELSGRFNYEFACCISKRVPRIYFKGGQVTE
ncbi:MAG TPA: alanine racemase [Candidatus Blautia stercorigallinarum]|uniref:Alanine racemase n=1 Tax=Candidatus Blautia stercorigallinarum TaxID=2838501 RepID=A0A9D1PFQ4_9FIRM|nr:alanine racemase [Candidatus Blautia stercorigallinarum]